MVFGLGAATAEVGGFHRGGGFGYRSNYCYSLSYYKTNYCSYPSYNYCNYDYGCYPYTCNYPVTTFDCYGRPYTVWQTGYGSTSAAILP